MGDPRAAVRDELGAPGAGALVVAAWGDLATLLVLAATALLGLKLAGHVVEPALLPWTLAVAALDWALMAAVLLAVRRATPGMLAADVAFSRPVPPRRLPWALMALLATVVSAGLLVFLGAGRLWRWAAAADLR